MSTNKRFQYSFGKPLQRALALVGSMLPLLAIAQPLPPHWQVQPVAQQEAQDDLPQALRTPVLALRQKPVAQVELLVARPIAEVLPVVQAALAPLGQAEWQRTQSRIAYLGTGSMGNAWGQVLMARRPELKTEFLQRFVLPELQRDVAEGALLATEIPARLERLRQDPSLGAQSDRLPALQAPFQTWTGRVPQRHGWSGRVSSRIEAEVIELDEVMQPPATVVRLRRVDTWPNPDGGIIGQLRALKENFLSPGPAAELRLSRVPEAVFAPVFGALHALPGAAVQLGPDARIWMPAPPPASVRTEPRPEAPPPGPGLPARRMLAFDPGVSAQAFEANNFLPLADGSVLLLQHYPFTLLRWSPADGAAPQVLWKADDPHASPGLLSGDAQGTRAYLASDGLIVRYQAGAAHVSVHPLSSDPPEAVRDSRLHYFSDGTGLPQAYRHDYTGPRASLSLWAARAPDLADGAVWHYARRFSAPRQGAMERGFPGNTQLKPVQWDGPLAQVWAEDAGGLAELDGRSGRILRALPLPRRFGPADAQDSAGMAQWVPMPFGSVRGGWIAVGFVLMDGQQRTPGLHVVDAASGRVRRSLGLPGLDSLNTAAGSPDGRLLALGGNKGGVSAALWNLEQATPMLLHADRQSCWDLRLLRFAPDGQSLWGLCGDGLVQWPLPPAWQSRPAAP